MSVHHTFVNPKTQGFYLSLLRVLHCGRLSELKTHIYDKDETVRYEDERHNFRSNTFFVLKCQNSIGKI